jgi:16S rRNA (uracil1498-N3)-methyltransferase
MRLHRFYVNKPLGEEIVVENVDGEKELIHQWTNVFRYTGGDEVLLFSSLSPGSDFLYKISEVSKQKVTLSYISTSANVLPPERTLIMALVKKDTFETIARQATELGVSRIIPLMAARSEKKNLNFERLTAIVAEAAEQSGRGTVPHIAEISSFEEAFNMTEDCLHIFGSLHGMSPAEALPGESQSGKELALWVGPEGGWTEEEEAWAVEKGVTPVKFIDTVLKADTAACVLLALAPQMSPQ